MSELTKYDQAVTSPQLVPESAKQKLQAFWKAHSKQIASVTAGADAERIMRVTYSVLYRNPKLIECTPFSLLNGIVLAHQMGLVLGTQEVALVPYGREATLIVQYQGKIKLALASKLIVSIHADVVMHGETFEFWNTERGPHFLHKPNWIDRPEPTAENIVGAYCQFETSGGGIQTRFCPTWEILAARSLSRGYRYQIEKGGTDNPWITHFGSQALKTAIHRAMKLAPQDGRLGLSEQVTDAEEGGAPVIAEGLNPAEFADKDLQQPLIETSRDAQKEIALNKLLDGIRKPADGLGVIGGLFGQLKEHGERGEDLYARVMERNGLQLSPSAKDLTVEKAREVIKGLWAAIELAKQPEAVQ